MEQINTVQNWLKESRETLGFTQKEMSEVLECSLRSYQNWEQGYRKPSNFVIKEVKRILDHKNKLYDDLVEKLEDNNEI